jgi:hypothetical protein
MHRGALVLRLWRVQAVHRVLAKRRRVICHDESWHVLRAMRFCNCFCCTRKTQKDTTPQERVALVMTVEGSAKLPMPLCSLMNRIDLACPRDRCPAQPTSEIRYLQVCRMSTVCSWNILFIGIRTLCDLFTRGYGDHSSPTSLEKPRMSCYVGARIELTRRRRSDDVRSLQC